MEDEANIAWLYKRLFELGRKGANFDARHPDRPEWERIAAIIRKMESAPNP